MLSWRKALVLEDSWGPIYKSLSLSSDHKSLSLFVSLTRTLSPRQKNSAACIFTRLTDNNQGNINQWKHTSDTSARDPGSERDISCTLCSPVVTVLHETRRTHARTVAECFHTVHSLAPSRSMPVFLCPSATSPRRSVIYPD